MRVLLCECFWFVRKYLKIVQPLTQRASHRVPLKLVAIHQSLFHFGAGQDLNKQVPSRPRGSQRLVQNQLMIQQRFLVRAIFQSACELQVCRDVYLIHPLNHRGLVRTLVVTQGLNTHE